jgi:NAD(P)-dependent dehydrogenase (short-subunit alcohol dehydrogenase family)
VNFSLITGCNRGIGLAMAQALSGRGEQVIAVCRQSSPQLAALPVRVETGVDVTDGASLSALAARLGDCRIDRLVLNAGTLAREGFDALDAQAFDRMREQFETNALGPLRVVAALQSRLVALITSRMGSISDNGSGGYYGYRASKAALNAIGKSLAEDLRPRGVAVFLLHPGYVRTDMTGGKGDVTPQQAAANLIARIDELGLAQSGSFWHANGEPLPW